LIYTKKITDFSPKPVILWQQRANIKASKDGILFYSRFLRLCDTGVLQFYILERWPINLLSDWLGTLLF